MWEMARTCSRLIHRQAHFLPFGQKYLCSPSPIVETNENFYTARHPHADDKFLTLQEMPLSRLLFSQACWCVRGSQQTVKNITFEWKREHCGSSSISLNTAESISKRFQGINQTRPEQFDLNLYKAGLLCALVLFLWAFIIGSFVISWLCNTSCLLHQSSSDNNWKHNIDLVSLVLHDFRHQTSAPRPLSLPKWMCSHICVKAKHISETHTHTHLLLA